MKNKWCITKSHKIKPEPIPGVYSAMTNSKRKLHCFANSPENAEYNFANGLKHNETISYIWRDSFE